MVISPIHYPKRQTKGTSQVCEKMQTQYFVEIVRLQKLYIILIKKHDMILSIKSNILTSNQIYKKNPSRQHLGQTILVSKLKLWIWN